VLVLLRHGQTAVNAEGRLLGRADPELTELGFAQARAAAVAIGEVGRVVSSPLQRARVTAECFGVPVEIDDRWIELDYGVLDGSPVGAVPAERWVTWRSDVTWAPEAGESLATLGMRVREACATLAADASERDVVVVTHVSPIKAAVAWALGVGDEVAWRMWVAPASITRIGVTNGIPSLRSFNDVAHLG
jgi:broad specificity phosphatase PhoE